MGSSFASAPRGSEARAADRRCADQPVDEFVRKTDIARSGEFTVGPFGAYGRPQFKLWWMPLVSDTTAALTVTAYRLDRQAEPVSYRQTLMAKARDGRRFYPTSHKLPSGVWALVGTAGVSWGCFVVEIPGAIGRD